MSFDVHMKKEKKKDSLSYHCADSNFTGLVNSDRKL